MWFMVGINVHSLTLDQARIQNSRLRFSTSSGRSLLAAVTRRMADREPREKKNVM